MLMKLLEALESYIIEMSCCRYAKVILKKSGVELSNCAEYSNCGECKKEAIETVRRLKEEAEQKKQIELKYLPNDTCWVYGQNCVCYIDDVRIERGSDKKLSITYTWHNLDESYELSEIWDEGDFKDTDIGKTVFDTYEDLIKAFPEDYNLLKEN